MKRTNGMLLLTSALCLSASAGYGLRVYAEGAPSVKPLFYAGTLEAGGKLASGLHTIALTFFDAESAGNLVCSSETPNVPVEAGRFRVEVSADCVAKLRVHADVWVARNVTTPDGVSRQLPGRTKIGAVPFAMEAQHAVSASSASAATGALTSQVVPAGAVVAFDLDACPPGWTELTAARGRTIVGNNPVAGGGISVRMRGQALGEERHALTTAELPPHTHAGTTGPGNAMPYTVVLDGSNVDTRASHVKGWNGSPGSRDYNDNAWALSLHTHNFVTDNGSGGNQPHNVMQPSLVLLYCKKS